ncbi:hypothetical protein A4E84_04275 [Streptomyces qaidamensis]|uniref:Uncharacterized protein n=1 Tax=Streptomyces qaidamensis TaxID=1783515 RepID=A0A143BVD8_9ACTN|nr:thioesterase domain-containing protein [Streptomyces qaidamensis]AMW08785.1 hypothetical protein A4E84_04275 [Streptomyces qaidamensis]
MTGEVAAFAEVAGHLAEGQRFYGLQERGLTGEDAPPSSVEEMATTYIGEMLRVQKEGPYLLTAQSGSSYVARRLTALAGASSRRRAALRLAVDSRVRLRHESCGGLRRVADSPRQAFRPRAAGPAVRRLRGMERVALR